MGNLRELSGGELTDAERAWIQCPFNNISTVPGARWLWDKQRGPWLQIGDADPNSYVRDYFWFVKGYEQMRAEFRRGM